MLPSLDIYETPSELIIGAIIVGIYDIPEQ